MEELAILNALKKRLVYVFIAFVYSFSFYLGYLGFLNFYFDYAGFDLFPRPLIVVITSFFISCFPIIFYDGKQVVSNYFSVFIFLLLYVPTIITFTIGTAIGLSELYSILIVFMCAMISFFLSSTVYLKYESRPLKNVHGFKVFLISTILCSLFVIVLYWGNLEFATFENIYDHRAENNDIGKGALAGYLMSWATTFIIPIVIIYGVINRKIWYYFVGSGSCVVLYMATASKGTLLMPLIILFLYLALKNNRIKYLFEVLTVLFSLSIFLLTVYTEEGNFFFLLSSMILFRTVGNGGYLNCSYYEFFSTHPKTYYSHIGPVNFFTQSYPYKDLGLGQVVGQYFWSDDMNANANFWATDGFAAMGLSGVMFVSIFMFFLFILMNALTKDKNTLFILLLFIPMIGSLTNTSLFSTMWSGGGFFMLLSLPILNFPKE